ncbi:hypothetical protein KEM56_002090 [Ascosphaera pollenicola]|nr:hypothetical protein KEM56_002090 [Ascosphaera pollenicola]
MDAFLLNRSQGSIEPAAFHYAQLTQLTHCLEPAPGIKFSSRRVPATRGEDSSDESLSSSSASLCAHPAGANVLALDQYDKRFMVSGGADATIHLWDLESRGPDLNHIHTPIASGNRLAAPEAHRRALTSLSIYPFDPSPATILTTSYDNTLKLSVLGRPDITPVCSFDLQATPYSHSLSAHTSSLLLVAAGTSDKAVRLVDLRSGLATLSLLGHDSSVLSVSWAPHNEYLLATGSLDNRALIFDVRRGGKDSVLAALDMDDAIGVEPFSTAKGSLRGSALRSHRAHNGPVTGVRWTDDGNYLVTAGQDSRIRVWNCSNGANTLVHFGPRVRNKSSLHLAERAPLLVPTSSTSVLQETLLWPNYNEETDRGEIYMFTFHDGKFIKTLKVPGLLHGRKEKNPRPTALSAARINSLAWRGNGASGQGLEMFSAHGDGTIRAWASCSPDDDLDEDDEDPEGESRKRKRDVLDEMYRGLMGSNVTFT